MKTIRIDNFEKIERFDITSIATVNEVVITFTDEEYKNFVARFKKPTRKKEVEDDSAKK